MYTIQYTQFLSIVNFKIFQNKDGEQDEKNKGVYLRYFRDNGFILETSYQGNCFQILSKGWLFILFWGWGDISKWLLSDYEKGGYDSGYIS